MSVLPKRTASVTELSEDDFRRFCEFFYRRTGIQFGANKRYFVDKRVLERISLSGLYNFREYFEFLKRDSHEYQSLVNAMTVNETYFYREVYQIECLVKSILPELVKRRENRRALRIWSVPCSTGEEPYSIAFFLLEHFARIDEFEVEIVASDIDTAVLDKAKAGIYSSRALQYVPTATLTRFTTDAGGEERRVVPALRNSIKFTNVNLLEAAEDRFYRDFDVVFCRNLLIYFDDVSRREAATAMFECMAPGGFVCLGHSESMSRISSLFQLRKFPEGIVYQKPM
jgi:chemotaxis protein methyltransferase CheR